MVRAGRGDLAGSRVFVELADGYNFVGTVVEDYVDGRGRRALLVKDTRGQQRTVRPEAPRVSISDAEATLDELPAWMPRQAGIDTDTDAAAGRVSRA